MDNSVRKSEPGAIENRIATIKAIKNRFISGVNRIYINSLKREVSFREVTVAEQKKLSRIMIDNENRKDIVYDAQCAVLQTICLEEGLSISSLTEFDKIKLLMLLYQRNMMKHEISFTCPECHTPNKSTINFENATKRLDSVELDDIEYVYENANWKFKFTLAYPMVSRVSDFYQQRYKTFARNADKKSIESFNTTVNIDYINLFIKAVEFTDIATNTTDKVSAEDFSITEFFDIISVFPQDVLYSERGIITYITTEFISKINDVFDKHECAICGHICENTLDSEVEGFL